MAILAFASLPFSDPAVQPTVISLSDRAATALRQLAGGPPAVCTAEHVARIVALADDHAVDSDLKLLADMIGRAGRAYIRFV